MRNQFSKTVVLFAIAIIVLAGIAVAQAPAPPATASSAVENPTYVTITIETDVKKPAAEVWARVGKYCDIAEWLRLQCVISWGKDGDLGAVRTLANGAIKEILVGKTPLSYTYTQPVAAGRPYNLYHGTVEARVVTATTSKIVYSLVWDNSMLADDAARDRDKTQRMTQFTTAIDNMRILAEGGTLPPAPARGGGGAGGAGGAGRGGAPAGAPPAGGRGQ